MKHFLPFTVFVLFFWGCQKATFEYAVVCEFPPAFSTEASTNLVITDDQGDVAGHFRIPLSATSFNQKFTFEARNASEKFGVSLIKEYFSPNAPSFFSISTHCGVPNGALVTLDPDFFTFRPGIRIFPIQITGVSRIDSVKLSALTLDLTKLGNDVWTTNVFMRTGQASTLHIFANGEKMQRTYWLRESAIPADTLRLNFNELEVGYKVSNLDFKLPEDRSGYTLVIDMISPDYKGFTHLDYAHNYEKPAINPLVVKPDAVPNDWLVYVHFMDQYSRSEQLFKPGEPLVVTRPTDFGVVSASAEPGQFISARTFGEVDLVSVTTNLHDSKGNNVLWTINGSTETFKHLELPELKRFFPNTDMYDQAFQYFGLSLLNLQGFDYDQLCSGFPWRSNDNYLTGRSNLRAVRKNY